MTKRPGAVEITPDHKVIIQAANAADAAELGAAGRDDILKKEGTIAAFIARLNDGWQNITEEGGRGLYGLLSWVVAAFAIYFAYTSFSRIFPDDPVLSLGAGVVGGALVLGMKVAGGKWAREYCERDKSGQMVYGLITIGTMLAVALVGASYQAAVDGDRDAGVIDANMDINEKRRSIRQSQYEREDMRRSPEWTFFTEEDLSADLARALSRPAYNRNGVATGDPIGDHVGLGTEEFCVGTSYYVERYCPDLLEIEGQLKVKVTYNEKVQNELALEAEIDKLENDRPQQNSTLALAKTFSSGIGAFFVAAGMLLIIDAIMVGFAWLSNWSKFRYKRQRGTATEPAS